MEEIGLEYKIRVNTCTFMKTLGMIKRLHGGRSLFIDICFGYLLGCL
jgi:hypothetical protein